MLNNASLPLAATSAAWQLPSRRKAAVAWLIVTESIPALLEAVDRLLPDDEPGADA